MKKLSYLRHSKSMTFFVLLLLVIISLGMFYYFPPNLHVERLSENSFGRISFSVALFLFLVIYGILNTLKLGWLGFFVSFFDAAIILYLTTWTPSAVYWSPVVVAFFNNVLTVSLVRRESTLIKEYEGLQAICLTGGYVLGGFLSCFMWVTLNFL